MIKLLLCSVLFFSPLATGIGDTEEPPVAEETGTTTTIPTDDDGEDKIKVVDEDGNTYWVDFGKVDWDEINIDWENLDKEEIVDIMFDIASQAMSPELLTLIMAVSSIALALIVCFFKYFKERTKANITANECANLTIDKINELVAMLKEKTDVKLEELTATSKIQSESMLKLLKVQALAQQNTAEAKKAIIDELVDSGRLEEKLAQETLSEIEKQVQEAAEHKESILNELDQMKNEDGTTI